MKIINLSESVLSIEDKDGEHHNVPVNGKLGNLELSAAKKNSLRAVGVVVLEDDEEYTAPDTDTPTLAEGEEVEASEETAEQPASEPTNDGASNTQLPASGDSNADPEARNSSEQTPPNGDQPPASGSGEGANSNETESK